MRYECWLNENVFKNSRENIPTVIDIIVLKDVEIYIYFKFFQCGSNPLNQYIMVLNHVKEFKKNIGSTPLCQWQREFFPIKCNKIIAAGGESKEYQESIHYLKINIIIIQCKIS